VIVQDSFSRTVAGGLGTAPTGGAYTVSGKGFSVDGSAAALSLTKGTRVAAPAVTAVDSDAMVRVVFPAIPSAGQLRGEVLSRATGVTATSTWYEADLFLASDGRLTVALALSAGGRRTQYARRKLGIYAAGDAYWMRFDTAGSPAALSARVWRAADTEPSAWTLQTTATGGPSAAGRPAIGAHFQGLAHVATIRFDDLTVASVPPQDTTAPSPPGALGFSNVGRTGATVGWAPATDDVGVDHYEVSVDGSDAGTPAANSLDLTGLECATAYDVVVRAVDAAGNVSGPSEATLTTADCPDTTPPSAPGAPAFTNVTATTATASWDPSTDNVAVTGYAVAVDGADAGGTATTSLALTDLACGADHVVEVRAHDAAGNDSDPATATLTTAACPDTTPPSAPGSLVADPGQSTIDLRWDASTDDVGVSGYQVTANGVLVDEPAGTTASVPARCGTPYHLEVVAVDAAGNVSAPAAADVGMPACGGEPGEVRLFAADVTPASLTNAIAQAAADREYQPDPDTGPAAGLGPNALQGVVHLAREPGAPAFDGANAITIDALVTMRSNVRMEVDSGIRFDLEAARLFDLTGLTNVTITHGDPSMGSGRTAGKFIVDMADAPTASKRTAVLLTNTTAFRVEWLHTIQSTVTGTAAVVMRGRPGPSNGIYQHHSNEGSPAGYGPNQIGSLRSAYIDDIWTDGGTALRLETDSNVTGVHDVTAEYLFGQNGNRVIALSPHCADSDHLTIRHIFGVSMIDGVRLAATSAQDRNPTTGILCDGIAAGHPGHFTSTTVTDGCVVSGTNAEQNYGSDVYHDVPPRTTSENVISNVSTAGTDVTIAGIGYDQSAAPFSLGTGSPVDASVPCSTGVARAGWPGF
jgi:chitodextrinase